MRSFRYLARVRAWLATPADGRGRPRAAWLTAVLAVPFTAVAAGSLAVHALTAGAPAGRPPSATPSSVTSAAGGGAGRAAGGARGGGPGAASPGADVRAELAARLDEILRVREAAYARRDATVLDTIYTADCACLRSGRAAIARLRADHAVWRGRSVSVRVERLTRVDDSLWIALAVLRRGAFHIEGEDGTLLSAEPAARQRYRFALVRNGTGPWLLGHASLVEELPP
jgi:hypothetical protein